MRLKSPASLVLPAAILAFASGCGSSEQPPTGAEGVTYYADVAPLVQRECLGCHAPGGIGPLVLDGYEELVAAAPLVEEAVQSGTMPPWRPDVGCMTYEHDRWLDEDERGVFSEWIDNDMARGDPADLPEVELPEEFEATHVARMKEAYTPDRTRPDDYRCFPLDLEFEEDAFVVGQNVVPGNSSLVHHVLVYAAHEGFAERIAQADEADPGPGYTCFGGPLPSAETANDSSRDTSALSMTSLGGWVPGQVPTLLRPGSATYVSAGSTLIMQVHYNILEQHPQPELTEVELIVQSEEPDQLVVATPVAITDLNIEAGEDSVVEQKVFYNYRSEPMRIVGVAPHMHLLGTEIRAERVPAVGEDGPSQCIVHIPEWDFEWQQVYSLAPEDTIEVAPGEGLRVTCAYDNSEEHQPVINGARQEPRDVQWGEGTTDEMCVVYFAEESEWQGPPPVGCEAATECLEDCDSETSSCVLDCEGIDGECRACVLGATVGCATGACGADFLEAAGCLLECVDSYVLLGGSYQRCVRAQCPDVADAALSCVAEEVASGACDDAIRDCGVEL